MKSTGNEQTLNKELERIRKEFEAMVDKQCTSIQISNDISKEYLNFEFVWYD